MPPAVAKPSFARRFAGWVIGLPGQSLFATAILLFALGSRTASGEATVNGALVETRHYRVHSDLPEDVVREMAAELEWCYQRYATRLSSLTPRQNSDRDLHEVRLFADHASYVRHAGATNSGGLYDSRRRLLLAFLGDRGRAGLKKTLRHEAFHQYAYEALGPGLPLWVNEGLAQLFEHGARVDDHLLLGELPEVPLAIVQRAMHEDRLFDFERLLRMNQREWFSLMDDRETGSVLYAQTWAMVHFLVYAADSEGRPLYRDRFNAFLGLVADGRPAMPAFRDQFGSNLPGFRSRFEAWLVQCRPTPVARELDRHDVLARMLGQLAERGVRFDRIGDFRDHAVRHALRLHREEDGIERVSDPDVEIYFSDSRGRPLGVDRLRFDLDVAGELPQLVTRPGDGYVYRTRFHRDPSRGGRIFHETFIHAR
ncbi:MAG: DUF1570 domain-containing protein [Planctomycetota bacterium]